MLRKRYNPEEIVSLLQRAEVLHGQGMTMVDAIRQLGISKVTFYRWRKEYGGMSGDQLRSCGCWTCRPLNAPPVQPVMQLRSVA